MSDFMARQNEYHIRAKSSIKIPKQKRKKVAKIEKSVENKK